MVQNGLDSFSNSPECSRLVQNIFGYMGTSLTRKRPPPLGPYHRPMPRVLGGSKGVGRFLMGEVPLQSRFFFDWSRHPERAREGAQLMFLSHRIYLLIGFRKSNPPQDRQLVVYYYLSKYLGVYLISHKVFLKSFCCNLYRNRSTAF